MRCISLWQPWASLIGRGKSIETRSWQTSYRGPIAIHAAKRFTAAEREQCVQLPFSQVLCQHSLIRLGTVVTVGNRLQVALESFLPFGAIVATATLVMCIRTDQVFTQTELPEEPWYRGNLGKVYAGANEWAFGDYTPGRFAWLLSDICILREPIPFKGTQGLFDVPDELLMETK